MTDFQLLQDKIGEWSDERNTDIQGLLNHLVEEAEDLKANPYSLMNYADVMILLMAAARKAGCTMEELYKAVEVKHTINESRIWMTPDETGITRHQK